jgi:hypothetical protein
MKKQKCLHYVNPLTADGVLFYASTGVIASHRTNAEHCNQVVHLFSAF